MKITQRCNTSPPGGAGGAALESQAGMEKSSASKPDCSHSCEGGAGP